MAEDRDAVVAAVRDRVEPSESERAALEDATERLVERARAAVAELPVDADVVHVGSTARDTWLSGDRDIDLFVRFSTDLDREHLERHGLAVGHAVLPDGREQYAEHPYVTGEYRGFGVDVVPCFDVDSPAAIRSAVDRTPFHTDYVRDRLTPALASDVRVCKQFLTGIGIYGSDLRTRGFSGFLTELLVVEYDGFIEFLDAASDWHPPVRLDPEDHGTATFDDPLVVVDPTDPERNVAAVLTATNFARLQHFARAFLAAPRESLFDPPERMPLQSAAVRRAFDERGTTPIALCFEAPDVVEDQLWPQLERSREGIAGELDRRGFEVFRSAAFVDDRRSGSRGSGGSLGTGGSGGSGGNRSSVGTGGSGESEAGEDGNCGETLLLFELAVAERPTVERHEGPPVHVRDHATSFYDTYADADIYGPFVDEDRYVVERPREWTTAAAMLRSEALFEMALGSDVAAALERDYAVITGDDVPALAGTFGEAFARYLDPTPHGI